MPNLPVILETTIACPSSSYHTNVTRNVSSRVYTLTFHRIPLHHAHLTIVLEKRLPDPPIFYISFYVELDDQTESVDAIWKSELTQPKRVLLNTSSDKTFSRELCSCELQMVRPFMNQKLSIRIEITKWDVTSY